MAYKSKGGILPPKYFEVSGEQIRLLMGPFCGVVFRFGGYKAKGIKILVDPLTLQDTLCYDYTIIFAANQPAGFDNTPQFSRIVAAIAIEILETEFKNGAGLESI